jgi:hypothetical protein
MSPVQQRVALQAISRFRTCPGVWLWGICLGLTSAWGAHYSMVRALLFWGLSCPPAWAAIPAISAPSMLFAPDMVGIAIDRYACTARHLTLHVEQGSLAREVGQPLLASQREHRRSDEWPYGAGRYLANYSKLMKASSPS